MILQSLVEYYNELVRQGKLKPGWAKTKISWIAEIDEKGNLLNLLPLKIESPNGKKMLPRELELPAPVKKSSGERSNFLWENAEYIFCLSKAKAEEAKTNKRFQTAKELHLTLLKDCQTPEACAVKAFFENWNIDLNSEKFSEEAKEDFKKGANITFFFNGIFISEYESMKRIWQEYYEEEADGETMIDLVSGKSVVPENIHPAIKGVLNAQSSGAALVSFNAKAYESFNREQNINAPVGKDTAFAYTSALNYLIADKEHRQNIGDMTVVYWAKNAKSAYQSVMDLLLGGSDNDLSDQTLSSVMENISKGNRIVFNEEEISPDSEFYILGLSPNAARISVRFFCRNTFGKIVENIKRHYDDIAMAKDNRNKWETIPLWALLRETVNLNSTDKSPSPQMSGDVLKTILFGGRYPETLLYQTLLRIRAEHNITRGRAAIIKGYLIRNTTSLNNYTKFKEVASVALNEESSFVPYVLGRMFSVLEAIQQTANPGINTTIKDKYFNSACSTPAAVFPLLLKLANSHLKKMATASQLYYSKTLSELTAKLGMEFPQTLSLQEQGTFILGYYHQTQKRFEKKNNNTEEN